MRNATLCLISALLFLSSAALGAGVNFTPGGNTLDDCSRINGSFGSQTPRCATATDDAGHRIYIIFLASNVNSANGCLGSPVPHFGVWTESNNVAGLQTTAGGDYVADTRTAAPCGPWTAP